MARSKIVYIASVTGLKNIFWTTATQKSKKKLSDPSGYSYVVGDLWKLFTGGIAILRGKLQSIAEFLHQTALQTTSNSVFGNMTPIKSASNTSVYVNGAPYSNNHKAATCAVPLSTSKNLFFRYSLFPKSHSPSDHEFCSGIFRVNRKWSLRLFTVLVYKYKIVFLQKAISCTIFQMDFKRKGISVKQVRRTNFVRVWYKTVATQNRWF